MKVNRKMCIMCSLDMADAYFVLTLYAHTHTHRSHALCPAVAAAAADATAPLRSVSAHPIPHVIHNAHLPIIFNGIKNISENMFHS